MIEVGFHVFNVNHNLRRHLDVRLVGHAETEISLHTRSRARTVRPVGLASFVGVGSVRLIGQQPAQIVLVVLFIDLAERAIHSTVECEHVRALSLGLAHLSSRLVWSVEVFWTYCLITDACHVILVGSFIQQISKSHLLITCIT